MTETEQVGDLGIDMDDDFVTTIEIQRPPANFFDQALICQLADTLERLDADDRCRAVVLCAQGKHFCAGANFSAPSQPTETAANGDKSDVHLYDEAVRLFATQTPVVAAIQGAAIGGGLGLALFSDFRVATKEARFSANFARLGFHQVFGLSVTVRDADAGRRQSGIGNP